MSADVYLLAPPALAHIRVGEQFEVRGDEGRHAVTVKRLTAGETVEVVDGFGRRIAVDVVDTVGKDVLVVRATSIVDEPTPLPRVVVVQAIPKGERGEVAVETLTEVGVDVIVPWSAQRCVTKWNGERAAKGLARWRRTAAESTKQARRSWIPEVTPLASTGDVVALVVQRVTSGGRAIVLHESAVLRLAAMALPSHADVVLIVGPEGGLTDEELGAFETAGAMPCRMGPSVLRTSTAGTAAAAVVLASTGRWS